jgi:hypothetical protein
MQARRGRDTVTTQTKNVLIQFAKQESEKAVKMKEKELKLEIHEKEIRIKELEAKSKPQIDVNPPGIFKPDNLLNLDKFLRAHKDMFTDVNRKHSTCKWRDLGSALEFSKEELENIDRDYKNLEKIVAITHLRPKEDHLNILLNHWLQRYPRDKRGSTSFATYTQLKTALINAGLGAVARDLPSYEEITTQ